MSFYRDKTEEYFLLDTKLENIFIHEFMAAAPESYLKVYLLALMYADLGKNITRAGIARHIGIEEEDVLKAWNYWESMGIIKKISKDSDDPFDYDVEFISLRQQMYGQHDSSFQDMGNQIGDSMSDPEIKKMVSEIERLTGRVFNSSEIRDVISWINEYQVLPEAVTYAFAFSVKKRRKTDIRYIEKIIRDWGLQGFKDVKAIEEHLSKLDKQNSMHRRVFQSLGFTRNPTEEERRIMDRWFEEMHVPLEVVLDACRKTSGISSPNINYVNKVIENWKADGKIRAEGGIGEPGPQEISSYYEKIRAIEEAGARKRLREVYEKVPEIKRIDEEMAGIGPELSKLIISDAVNKKEVTEKLRQKEEELRIERAFLLTDNGFEPDYTEKKYRCPYCEDTGRMSNGEACKCQKEITREEIDRILSLKQ